MVMQAVFFGEERERESDYATGDVLESFDSGSFPSLANHFLINLILFERIGCHGFEFLESR